MREIKFRSWDPNDKRMVQWDELLSYIETTGSSHNLSRNQELLNRCMQYTGLKDRNGKEIYEGDIIKTSYHNQEIYFGWGDDNEQYRESYGWCTRDLTTKEEIIIGPDANETKDFEVVGNVHENPELLK